LSAPASIATSGVRFRADAAAHGQRNEQLARNGTDGVGQRTSRFDRRRDVEDHQLVDSLGVVTARQLRGIAGGAETFEVDALDDLAIPHIQARDDSLG
jgi:hypothetical protein